MGIFAVVNNNIVENVIVLNEIQLDTFETLLQSELVDALPYGLCIGDLRISGNWTRNINGVQVILEELTPQQQTDYGHMVEELEGKTELLEQIDDSFTEGVNSTVNEPFEEETEGEQALELLNNIENSLREGVESVG